MIGRRWWIAGWLLVAGAAPAQEREKRPELDVEHYVINAEVNTRTQSLRAEVQIKFTPLEDTPTAIFELNNGLNVTKVIGPGNTPISAVRYQQDFTVRLNFGETLKKGQPATVTFTYDGRIAGLF